MNSYRNRLAITRTKLNRKMTSYTNKLRETNSYKPINKMNMNKE